MKLEKEAGRPYFFVFDGLILESLLGFDLSLLESESLLEKSSMRISLPFCAAWIIGFPLSVESVTAVELGVIEKVIFCFLPCKSNSKLYVLLSEETRISRILSHGMSDGLGNFSLPIALHLKFSCFVRCALVHHIIHEIVILVEQFSHLLHLELRHCFLGRLHRGNCFCRLVPLHLPG